MQMAMVLTSQKPTQRNRPGEVPEGLPGSSLERGMRERKRRELGRSYRFLIPQKRPEDGCKADGYCATEGETRKRK